MESGGLRVVRGARCNVMCLTLARVSTHHSLPSVRVESVAEWKDNVKKQRCKSRRCLDLDGCGLYDVESSVTERELVRKNIEEI